MSQAPAVQPPGESRAPWERRADESDPAFACFVVYRDQTPPRSIRKAAASLERDKTILEDWSTKYAWVERASAYTDHLDRLVLAAHEEDIVQRRREMNDRVFAIAAEIQDATVAKLVGVKDENGKVEVTRFDVDSLDWDDIMRGFETSTKAQRLVLGLPTDVTGQITVSLSDMDAIMRGFLKLAEKRLPAPEYQALVRDCYALIREQLGG